MEPMIYKPDAYKSPGVYKGAGGIYKGRGVYNDGAGGSYPVPPPPPGYTIFKYLENKNFSDDIIAYFGDLTINWNYEIDITLEFKNGIPNEIIWYRIVTDWYSKNGCRFSQYGERAIQSGWNKDFGNTPHIQAPGNDYNNFLDANKQIKIVLNKEKIIINGEEHPNTSGPEVETITFHGTMQSSSDCLSRFLELNVFDENKTLIEKIVPCKNPEDKSGFLRLFSGQFFNNNTNFICKDE